MDDSFWLRQTPKDPLFPEIDWSRPETKRRGGKLLIVGGHQQAFQRMAQSYEIAKENSVGSIKAANGFTRGMPTCIWQSQAKVRAHCITICIKS